VRVKSALSPLTSHFLPGSLPLSCLGLGAVRRQGRTNGPLRSVTTAGVLTMSDLADRLAELEHRVTELRDFL